MHASAGVASHIALSLHQTNNAVFAFDQESHGKSEGPKGNIRDINEYIDCGIIFIQKTLELYQANTPIFIIGESMGGLICINISIRIPALIRGMILFAPAVGLAQTPSCFDKFLLGLALCCCPNANAAGKDDGFSEMSRNE